jgi:hypothetical protein
MVVWDKACTVRFKRLAGETLFVHFHLDERMLWHVREEVQRNGEGTFPWPAALQGLSGTGDLRHRAA